MAASVKADPKKVPLPGVTVPGFSHVIAGPFCTLVLAEGKKEGTTAFVKKRAPVFRNR